ncbi:MAG: AAA family ATPase [Planctomycetota bacterium]|nr:AAA family ATPase [Planctomycetota bacterium]
MTATPVNDGRQLHELNSGSRWNRWEPHVHAPGTVLNDQFKGADRWEDYLNALEVAMPPIRAIGVTDYYSTEIYERVCDAKRQGRLPGCDLIFPNIEMRLGIGTVKGKWVNLHLLVSPEDPDHLAELKRFLARLTFSAYDDSFCCNKDDLIRLGQRHDSKLTDTDAALKRGAEQFKVSFDPLKQAYNESAWAQQNILIAVSGNTTDGTSGVRDAADATLRQEVEKFAHVIFASSPAQREFWLGLRHLSEEILRQSYGGLKPCMHGSDAHKEKMVGAPDGKRYSWVKGAPAFDTLRQACIDPAGRAFVGEEPPTRATRSQIISSIEIKGAAWTATPIIELNPGLVAIIGARGSGKTALADVIALGCDATSERLSPASFLTRAQDLLHGASVSLKWETGDFCQRNLDLSDEGSAAEYPRARYLSQQFVEELCSAHGMTDALLREIERVIFESHSLSDRDGQVDFEELLKMKADRFREARAREEEALADLSERIGTDLEKDKLIAGLRKQITEKARLIEGYTKDRSKLVSKGSEVRVQRLGALAQAAEKVRGYVRFYAAQEQSLLCLKDEVSNLRSHEAPEALRGSQERHKASGLNADEWVQFLLDYKGDVDTSLTTHLQKARKGADKWKGTTPAPASDPNLPLIKADADLRLQPVALLEAEIARIERLVSMDRETSSKFSALSKRITEENTALERLKERLADCEGAMDRVKALVRDREAAYARVFDAILAEQAVLAGLYSPLMTRLDGAGATLKKLSFSVRREADVVRWAEAGEDLLDLRRLGSFKGRGTLRQLTDETLKAEWETGNATAVSAAMAKFRTDNDKELLDRSQVLKADQADYRAWAKKFAKWLYSTEHISLHYSIDYDGVDIRKLSPGTRGIVLLLLYLALDEVDDRPLIIDQPEENLDPKSIFDELVGLFLGAKNKRQVILVTHNANLVVNADADQVIVAEAGPHPPGELPPISYLSGGLESAHIRKAVCDILEGGERAFQERARRLRVRLER